MSGDEFRSAEDINLGTGKRKNTGDEPSPITKQRRESTGSTGSNDSQPLALLRRDVQQDTLNNQILKRLEKAEDQIARNKIAIQKLDAYSRRKNINFDGLFLKTELEDPTFDLKKRMLHIINNRLFIDATIKAAYLPQMHASEIEECHPTQTTLGPYRQVIVRFASHDRARHIFKAVQNLKPMNDKRIQDERNRQQNSGAKRRAYTVRVKWQMEPTANSQTSYLSELKRRILEKHQNLNAKNIIVEKPQKALEPYLQKDGNKYTVTTLPDEYVQEMGGHWHEGWIRAVHARKPNNRTRRTDPQKHGSTSNDQIDQ